MLVGICYDCVVRYVHDAYIRQAYIQTDQVNEMTPNLKTLEKWDTEGYAKATDGCIVEPDGTCPHGKQSWLLVLGMI